MGSSTDVMRRCGGFSTDKRGALLVVEGGGVPAGKDAQDGAEHGDQADDEKGECRPVDKLAAGLVLEDGQQTETDDERTCDVALTVPDVSCRGGLEEEKREEDDNLGDDARLVRDGVDAKGLETGDKEEDDDEAVVEAEGEVDEDGICEVGGRVVNLKRAVAVRDGTCDEEHDDEGEDGVDSVVVRVELSTGESAVDSVQDAQSGESPTDAVDDVGGSSVGELVDDHTKEQCVDERPYTKDPSFGSEVGFLNHGVGADAKLGIDVTGCEEHIGNDVGHLEEEIVVPRHLDVSLRAKGWEESGNWIGV